MRVVLTSWNVHGWVGADGARDPARGFEVIRELDADAVALQEVEGCDWEELARGQGYQVVIGSTGLSRRFGNALLHRDPLVDVRRVDLSVAGRQPRGALDAVLSLPAGRLRMVTAHFGLRAAERRHQAAQLARHIAEHEPTLPVVLMGDLNDWTPWGGQLLPLVRALGPVSRIPTYPSRRPLFAVDRAAWRAPGVARLEAVGTGLARRASDHLPLRLELRADSLG